ncbi:MAG: alkaline phosphatase family protein, partial [Deltaproteobacteria bacterium]
RLVLEGIRGDMQAPWPPYWSVPAWAAILTAHSPEENGVFGDMIVEAPGLPDLVAPTDVDLLLDPFFLLEFTLADWGVIHLRHPRRRALHSPPVWELLSRAGIETGVIRFDFTYPAEGEAEFIVSSWAGRDTWQLARAGPARGQDIASAAARRAGLLEPFSDDEPPDARLLAELLPRFERPAPADAVVNPFSVLRIAAENERRTLEAAERLIHVRPALPFLAVYVPGFDKVCHAFWQYRFPEAYGDRRPAAEDIAELGPVVDRYLAFVDRSLGHLIAAYGEMPNVIVVSDHGFEANTTHPMWRGWHSARGIAIAAGPSFGHRDAPLPVSYYDVVPTVMDVMGFAAPDGMRGSSLLRR